MRLPYALQVSWLTIKKSTFWIVLYVFGYFQWDIRWLVLLSGALYLTYNWTYQKKFRAMFAGETQLPRAVEKDLPAWVLHPDAHRSEWTNTIFKRLWPHLETFLADTLRSVESDPLLQERLQGYHIRSINFPDFSLGQIPPKITGIKVHQAVHRDEIIVDLNVQYQGDLQIILEVLVNGLPNYLQPIRASLNNMSCSGTLRVHLRPLLKDVPFIGGLTLLFLQTPEIDFDLGGIANTLDIPGIGLLLRHVIQDQLEQTIVMPNSLTVSMVDEDKMAALSTARSESAGVRLPAGVISINIIEGKGLVNKDVALLGQGKSDPYTKATIVVDGMAHVFKTEVVPNNLHPVWRHVIDMPVDNPETLDDIKIEVWDEDRGNKDDFMGRCSIPVKVLRTAMTSGQSQDVWRELQDVKRGSFHAEVSWAELKIARIEDDTRFHKGVVSILVDSCSNLLGGRTGLKLPNPKVCAEICTITQSTDTVIGSVNPVFSHRMNFLVRDPASDTLKLSVVDAKRNEILGSARIHISDLLQQAALGLVNQKFVLSSRLAKGVKSPVVTLSLLFRYIHRPTSSSFGVHKSLQDLHKIMAATVKPTIAIGTLDHSVRAVPRALPRGPSLQMEDLAFMDDTETCSTSSSDEKMNPDQINNNIGEPNLLDARIQPALIVNPAGEGSPTVWPNRATSVKEGSPPTRNASFSRSLRKTKGECSTTSPLTSLVRLDSRPRVLMTLRYQIRSMTLYVVIHKVKNLQNTSFMPLPSPYVKLYMIQTVGVGCSRRIANSKRKTSIHKQAVHPIFEETLEYFVPLQDVRHRRLESMVCSDGGVLGRNSVIGRTIADLECIQTALVSPHAIQSGVVEVKDWYVLNSSQEGLSEVMNGTSSSLPRSQSASATLPRRNGSRSIRSSTSFEH